MYLHLHWVDLVAGYRRFQQASHRLINKWLGKLMAAYLKKMKTAELDIYAPKK